MWLEKQMPFSQMEMVYKLLSSGNQGLGSATNSGLYTSWFPHVQAENWASKYTEPFFSVCRRRMKAQLSVLSKWKGKFNLRNAIMVLLFTGLAGKMILKNEILCIIPSTASTSNSSNMCAEMGMGEGQAGVFWGSRSKFLFWQLALSFRLWSIWGPPSL